MNRKNRRLVLRGLRKAGVPKLEAKNYIEEHFKNTSTTMATITFYDGSKRKITIEGVTDYKDIENPQVAEAVQLCLNDIIKHREAVAAHPELYAEEEARKAEERKEREEAKKKKGKKGKK